MNQEKEALYTAGPQTSLQAQVPAEEKRKGSKRKHTVLICVAVVTVLAVALVLFLLLKKDEPKTVLEKLKVGMTPEEVEDALGEPDREDEGLYLYSYTYEDVEILGREGELTVYFFVGDTFSGAQFKTWIDEGDDFEENRELTLEYFEDCTDYLSDIYGDPVATDSLMFEEWYLPIYHSGNRRGLYAADCGWGYYYDGVTSADMLSGEDDGGRHRVYISWAGQEAVEDDD